VKESSTPRRRLSEQPLSALSVAGGILTALTAATFYFTRRRTAPAGHAGDENSPITTPASSPQRSRGLTRQDIWSALGALGGILTLVTAVMFYFGWRRADVQASAMSIDVSLFGFSTQDYVLRSISSLYLPLLGVFALILGWLWLHSLVVHMFRTGFLKSTKRRNAVIGWSTSIAAAGIAVALWCLLFTAATALPPPRPAVMNWLAHQLVGHQWVVPLTLITATLVAAYAWWIYRRIQPAPVVEDRPLWQTLLPAVLVVGIVVLSASWLLEEYATIMGHRHALQISSAVNELARAVVISPTPLGLDAAGVEEHRIVGPEGSDVRYRITGLRLLARSGGKVLLVHDGWAPGNGTVIVLPDSDQLSWQFSR
jgi:hypothetical protein